VAFRDLGCEPTTFGHWSHENSMAMFGVMPRAMLMKMSKEGVDAYHKKLEDEAKKNGATADEVDPLAPDAEAGAKVDDPNELK